MNTRTAAIVAVTVSLALALTGCGGAAADAQGASEIGLSRGHVMRDDLPRTPPRQAVAQRSEVRDWSSDALREFHGVQSNERTSRTGWSAEVMRELKGSVPRPVQRSFAPEVMRELKGSVPTSVQQSFAPEVMRELKGSTSQTGESR